jgi:chlorite dismutase
MDAQGRDGKTEIHNFAFYRISRQAMDRSDEERNDMKEEFSRYIESIGLLVNSYSLAGLRPETDFMLHFRHADVRAMQQRLAASRKLKLSRYLETPYTYLCTKRSSEYSAEGTSEVHIASGEGELLFVYPFIKTREWYLLSPQERRRIMEEHIRVGRKYPGVRINTAYSFGIGDQDFFLSFDGNDLYTFQTLVMELRNTEASRYTVRDTPMFVCVKKGLRALLNELL